jgi:thiol-disulfide isomerase/thioredoxin
MKYIFSLAYLVAFLATDDWRMSVVFNPILFAFIIHVLGHWFYSLRKQLSLQFFVVSACFFYAFTVYNHWLVLDNAYIGQTYDFREIPDNDPRDVFGYPVKPDVDIKSFKFESRGNDSLLTIPIQGMPVIIETWNERCVPCLRAIRDLQQFFKDNAASIGHYYVYEPELNRTFSQANVFEFEEIDRKERILIDRNNAMYEALGLSGYPYFLLFDGNGKLARIQFGYSDEISSDMKAVIESMWN